MGIHLSAVDSSLAIYSSRKASTLLLVRLCDYFAVLSLPPLIFAQAGHFLTDGSYESTFGLRRRGRLVAPPPPRQARDISERDVDRFYSQLPGESSRRRDQREELECWGIQPQSPSRFAAARNPASRRCQRSWPSLNLVNRQCRGQCWGTEERSAKFAARSAARPQRAAPVDGDTKSRSAEIHGRARAIHMVLSHRPRTAVGGGCR